jgi:hypothetical protein
MKAGTATVLAKTINKLTQRLKTMKTTENIISKTLRPFSKRVLTARSVRTLVAACATFLAGIGMPERSYSQMVYSVNIVGCVPDMTIQLLTAPLTTTQRQMLHAQNFNSLPLFARPVYLHSVAYAIGFKMASNGYVPTSAMIAEHFESISSIYEVSAIPPEDSQSVSAILSVADDALKELNALILVQVASNTNYRQAMYAGAVDGFVHGGYGEDS